MLYLNVIVLLKKSFSLLCLFKLQRYLSASLLLLSMGNMTSLGVSASPCSRRACLFWTLNKWDRVSENQLGEDWPL